MWCRFGSEAKRGLRGERGALAVEAAIILPVLILLILGGMDLGHRYYMQHLITNASREGARYAAKYRETTADPTSSAISDYVKLPAGLNYNRFGLDTLVVSSTPPTGTFPNSIMTVTVKANKHWWVLGTLKIFGFAGFTNPKTLTATTAMNVEH